MKTTRKPRFNLLNESKIGRALKVIDLVSKGIAKHPKRDWFYLETYHNGREQGFSIKFAGGEIPTFTFSEYRNSDSMVVYATYGYREAGIPSDEEHRASRSFESEELAAEFILKEINQVTFK